MLSIQNSFGFFFEAINITDIIHKNLSYHSQFQILITIATICLSLKLTIVKQSKDKSKKMQAMINRWNNKLSSMEERHQHQTGIPPHPPKNEVTDNEFHIYMKKSLERSKKSLHSNEGRTNSKRVVTPSKKKIKNQKAQAIDRACYQIFEIFAKANPTDKAVHSKIKNVLEQVWSRGSEVESVSPRNVIQTVTELQNSMMKESAISTTAVKRQQKLYQDLQKRYFQSEKQRQFLKSKIDEILKKYQNIDKQLERFSKMERLVENILERDAQTKQQNKKLKNELHMAQLKEIQQQKIFQSEINVVRELVEEIKKSLPSL